MTDVMFSLNIRSVSMFAILLVLFLSVRTIPLTDEKAKDVIVSSGNLELQQQPPPHKNTEHRQNWVKPAYFKNHDWKSWKNSSFSFGGDDGKNGTSLMQELDEMMKDMEHDLETFFNETFSDFGNIDNSDESLSFSFSSESDGSNGGSSSSSDSASGERYMT